MAFWDFQGEGPRHVARGAAPFALEEREGPVARAGEGVFGPRSLDVRWGQWLRLPRAELGALNFSGKRPLSLVVWAKPDSGRLWQFLAGVWDERRHRRQYALFYNGAWRAVSGRAGREPCRERVHAYLSREGGHTPGHPACFSYATGAAELPPGQWHCFAMTFDGAALRAFANGRLDVCAGSNPLGFDGPVFDGGADGADFTVAQRNMAAWEGYPDTPMPADEGFSGLLGGVAVYDRALDEREIAELSPSAAPEGGAHQR